MIYAFSTGFSTRWVGMVTIECFYWWQIMFEKEAEEFVENLDDCHTKEMIRDAFKDGAEFGYNKAKEDADKMKSRFLELCNLKDMRIEELEKVNEWQYPSKGEYPECDENKKLWLYFKDYYANDRSCEYPIYRTSTGVYKTSFLNEDVKLFVEKSKGYESEILPRDIIAWQYLPEPPKEIE